MQTRHATFKTILKKQGLLLAFLILIVVFTIWNPKFIGGENIMLVLRQVTLKGIIACGMTLVIVGGNFDLSVGSLMSFTAVIAVSLCNQFGPLVGVLAALAVGLISGAFSGWLVGYLKLGSMIVTLGMMSILQAVTLIYTNGQFYAVEDPSSWYSFIAGGYVFNIPFPIILYVLILIIFALILTKTVFGRKLKAVGANKVASRFAGINDSRVILASYIASGLMAAIAGIIVTSRAVGAQTAMGQNYEFEVITAVILGGANLNGGEGSIYKTMLGVLILGFLYNGFTIIGLPYYVQWLSQWVIIVGVVWLDITSKKKGVAFYGNR